MKSKNIMNSHEEYCRCLKIAIKRYTDFDILSFIEKNKNKNAYKDYVKIYEDEKKLRNI